MRCPGVSATWNYNIWVSPGPYPGTVRVPPGGLTYSTLRLRRRPPTHPQTCTIQVPVPCNSITIHAGSQASTTSFRDMRLGYGLRSAEYSVTRTGEQFDQTQSASIAGIFHLTYNTVCKECTEYDESLSQYSVDYPYLDPYTRIGMVSSFSSRCVFTMLKSRWNWSLPRRSFLLIPRLQDDLLDAILRALRLKRICAGWT